MQFPILTLLEWDSSFFFIFHTVPSLIAHSKHSGYIFL